MIINRLYNYTSRSIRLKFIFLLSFLFLLMGIVTATFFITRTKQQLHSKLVEKGVILAEDLAYNATFGLAMEDPEILGILINGVINRQDVAYVIIYDVRGREMAFKDPLHVRKIIKSITLDVNGFPHETIVSLNTISKINSFYDIIVPVVVKKTNSTLQKEGNAMGVARVGVSLNSLDAELRNILIISISITGIIILFSIGIALVFVKMFVRPVLDMAASVTTIAEGDFTQTIDVNSKDEVGILGNAFRKMAGNLKEMLKSIQDASKNVVSASHHIGISSNNVSDGAQRQSQSIEKISNSIEGINTSIRDVANSIDSLSTSVVSTSSSIIEMETSINEVANHTGVLETSVEETTSAIMEMSDSIKQVADHADILADATEKTVLTIQEINLSIDTVEESAIKAAKLSEKVSEDAAKMGLQSVRKTMEGMENIKEAIVRLAKVINELGTRSAQVGGILTIIDEVTDQTGLLALNAAILAAQSGEHGRGFAVVADEIKELSEKTAASTREIAQLIADVQTEVADAVTLTKDVMRSVEEGSRFSIESDVVLQKILKSAEESMEMARIIEQSTVQQVNSIKEVTEPITRINSMIKQIVHATQEQNSGIQRIVKTTEGIRDISKMVRRAASEQASGSSQIAEAMTSVNTKVQEIVISSNEQTKESQKIFNSIDDIRSITQRNVDIAAEMAIAVNLLAKQSELLEAQARKFKI
ncbi:MAG: methyl-accepting chemotaxis protein [Nitrospirae bacterium]|nr:methyl-accepting chemotaxis protein [Nitrospirota bacterium]